MRLRRRITFQEALALPGFSIYESFPRKPTAASVRRAITEGMIPKAALVHNALYEGYCRNALVTRWRASIQRFTYRLVGGKYIGAGPLENIPYPSDWDGWDIFVPVKRVTAKASKKNSLNESRPGPRGS
jgi:hypothetical protein